MKKAVLGLVAGMAIGAVGLGGVSYAATGGSFLLGSKNTASGPTSLTSTGKGPVLTLGGAKGQVPLSVAASSGKATNLNADKLDGLHSSSFALAAGQVGSIKGTTRTVDVDGDGTSDVLEAYAPCPSGTVVTGGGFEDYTTHGVYENEASDNGWVAFATMDSSSMDSSSTVDDLTVYAQCYNPRGSVAGSSQASHAARYPAVSASEKAAMERALAHR